MAAGSEFTIARSLPHGHVAAVAAMAHQLGLPALLGPSCRSRDLVLALIVSRVVRPASKLATAAWWPDVTLGPDLDVAGATTDEIYAAMDWLLERQDAIEAKLAAKHLRPEVNPSRMALFDLTSSWVTGRCCELAARGYSRDGKKGCEQIEYGILTDPDGRPVAVRVFEGNTADPVAFTEIVPVVRDTFGLDEPGAGRRSRHDHHRPHRCAARTQRRSRHRNGFRLDHRAARPRRSPNSPAITGRCK